MKPSHSVVKLLPEFIFFEIPKSADVRLTSTLLLTDLIRSFKWIA